MREDTQFWLHFIATIVAKYELQLTSLLCTGLLANYLEPIPCVLCYWDLTYRILLCFFAHIHSSLITSRSPA